MITGFIGGFAGFMFQKIYSNLSDEFIWNIVNTALFVAIGAIIGYFNSKRKKEELQVELMILEDLQLKPKQ